jgi:uncharacterized membrane protein YciS (DUF1049 family)
VHPNVFLTFIHKSIHIIVRDFGRHVMLGSLAVGTCAGWVIFFGALLARGDLLVSAVLGIMAGILVTLLVAIWQGYAVALARKRAQARLSRGLQKAQTWRS